MTPLVAEVRARLAPVVAAHGDRWIAVPWHITEGPPEVRVQKAGEYEYLLCCPVYDVDAALIAAAPADLAALCDRVEALEEMLGAIVDAADLQTAQDMARAALGDPR